MKCTVKNRRGFTLIELLVVVAIVGILSAVGIPSYRRMSAKSRKSEAKVGLGSIYTASTAFQAEYGAYGNNLGRIGTDIAGAKNYAMGFPAGASGTVACAQDVAKPLATVGVGPRILVDYPPYYAAPIATLDNSAGITNCYVGTAGTMDNGGTQFLATASGCVRAELDTTCVAADQDQWTINPARNLTNSQEGVP